jgi:hypothetical protein
MVPATLEAAPAAVDPPVQAAVPRKKACPVCRAIPNCNHTPPHQLRVMLAISRRHGIVFDDAWEKAWIRVRWPHDTEHRRDYKKILLEQLDVWRSAYARMGAVNERLNAVYSLLIYASGEGG